MNKPNIDPTVFVAEGAIIKYDVTIGKDSSVWYNAVIRGDNDTIKIGERTSIQECSVLHVDPGNPIIIGDDVTVGHNAVLHGCTIGNATIVGMGAIVLDDAIIGNECIIAAGSVVKGGTVIPDRSLVAGNPASIKKTLDESRIPGLYESAQEYVEASRRELELMKA